MTRLCFALLLVLAQVTLSCGQPATQEGAPASRPSRGPRDLPPISHPDPSWFEPAAQRLIAAQRQQIDHFEAEPTQRAAATGKLGMIYQAHQLWTAAEACYLHALALEPNHFHWRYFLGIVYHHLNRTEAAREHLLAALALNPNHYQVHYYLGEVARANGDPTKAEHHFQKLLEVRPQDGPALLGMGQTALTQKQFGRALTYLEKVIRDHPRATNVHFLLAEAYRGLGNMAAARAHLNRAGEGDLTLADPLLAEVLDLRMGAASDRVAGIQALQNGKVDEAFYFLNKAATDQPGDATNHFYLGLAWVKRQRPQAAAKAFHTVLEKARENDLKADTHFQLARLSGEAGQWDQAANHLAATVQFDPSFTAAHFRLAELHRAAGRWDQALASYENVVDLQPHHASGRLGRALCLIRLGRHDLARDHLRQDSQVLPGQQAFQHALARLLAASPHDSVRDGSRALQILGNLTKSGVDLELAESLAMACAEIGRWQEAVQWQGRALELARAGGAGERLNRLKKQGDLYGKGMACRQPWADDDPLFRQSLPGF